jgi:hypothetical protein
MNFVCTQQISAANFRHSSIVYCQVHEFCMYSANFRSKFPQQFSAENFRRNFPQEFSAANIRLSFPPEF